MLAQVAHQEEGVRVLRRVLEGALRKPLLVVGPQGVGKRFAVNQLVREMFCSGTKEDTCRCHDCVQLEYEAHPDLWQVTAGDKDIGVAESRAALKAANSYPTQADVRAFVLDGADRLTAPAANALLKLLEEPPPTTRFFLIAELSRLVLPTIRSRCGLVVFRPWAEAHILEKVAQYESNSEVALAYARLGGGSVGESLRLWGSGKAALRNAIIELLQSAKARDYPRLYASFEVLTNDLLASLQFLDFLLYDLAALAWGLPVKVNVDLEGGLRALGEGVPVEKWLRLQRSLQEARELYRKTKINLGFHMREALIDAFS